MAESVTAEAIHSDLEAEMEYTAHVNLLQNCVICKKDLCNRQPKLLPCLHSMCLACVPMSVHPPQVAVIICPECSQKCDQKDIVENIFINDFIADHSSSPQFCTSCQDHEEATDFCSECVAWLCHTCRLAHKKLRVLKHHRIQTKGDLSPECVGASMQQAVFCPDHKSEQLKLFCETCNKLTCRDCQLLKHREHRYQYINEAFQFQKVIIDKMVTQLIQKNKHIIRAGERIQNRLEEITQNANLVEENITFVIHTLLEEISKKGNFLLKKLECLAKEQEKKLLQQKKEMEYLSNKLTHCINFSKWAVSGGRNTALLFSKNVISDQIRSLLRERCDVLPESNTTIQFQCDPHFWAQNISNLGNLITEEDITPYIPKSPVMQPQYTLPNQQSNFQTELTLAQEQLQKMQYVHAQKHPQKTRPGLVECPNPRIGQESPLSSQVECPVSTYTENIVEQSESRSPSLEMVQSPNPSVSSPGLLDEKSQNQQDSCKGLRGRSHQNEDYCAVCQNGGKLICCDKCPRVFHLKCHVPALKTFPRGPWFCTFCCDLTEPKRLDEHDGASYVLEEKKLESIDQRKFEKILLNLYCQETSHAFQKPVPPTMTEYHNIIKNPMDLSTIVRKLRARQTLYTEPEDIVADFRLIFQNCAAFHKPDSEMANAGNRLREKFETLLTEFYPNKQFGAAS